jgi:hypothetical protein
LLAVVLLIGSCGKQGEGITRQRLYAALQSNHLLNPDRKLVHFHHTCDLVIEGKHYPVADVQEIIPGPMTARGDNRVIVFTQPLDSVVQNFEYTLNRPLFCSGNQLIVFGDLRIEGSSGSEEGNALTFTEGGKRISLSHLEPQNYPVPDTRNRRDAGQ